MAVDDRLAPSGVFLLRIALGMMYLAHSVVLKLLTFGLAGTAQFFVSIGLPAGLAYLTFAAEAVGGLLLVLGIQSRWVALALLPPVLGAIIWGHGANVHGAWRRLGISGLSDHRQPSPGPAR